MIEMKLEKDTKLICIDYDGTYTESPELFDYFIKKAKELGFSVIGCTMRYENEIDEDLRHFEQMVDELYFSERRAKKKYLEELNINPQIWIDDTPEWLFVDSI